MIQELNSPYFQDITEFLDFSCSTKVKVLRLDAIHPHISGNKWFKLKNNIAEAKRNGFKTILTFGGAFSNHIAATAEAGYLSGINTIGVIRGEEGTLHPTSTLKLAKEKGMHLHFVKRGAYKLKETTFFFEELKARFGSFYLIPEGGANVQGVLGCTEILTPHLIIENSIAVCCACGTATTLVGISLSLTKDSTAIGVPVLKAEGYVKTQLEKFYSEIGRQPIAKIEVWENYHFGGYAKYNQHLIDFMNTFHESTGIPLDIVYTSKLMFAVLKKLKENYFEYFDEVWIIHSGGLQGNSKVSHLLK